MGQLQQGISFQLRENPGKTFSNRHTMFLHIAQEIVWETALTASIQFIEHLLHVFTDGGTRHTGFYPVIQAKRGELSFENRHRIEKYPGSLNLSLHHFQRFFKEELVVWIPFGNGNV